MNNIKLAILALALSVQPISKAMLGEPARLVQKVQQLAVINPFFAHPQSIVVIKKVMDEIEDKRRSYPDYSKRTGLIWSDFWVKTKAQPEIVEECKETVKLSLVSGLLQRHYPESVFDYPDLKGILTKEILPKLFAIIREKQWATLPKKVFAQLFVQRCHTSEAMDWHQDPGEDYDTMADFSLVLLLSKQDDPEHGWGGGEFRIRAGLPSDTFTQSDVTPIEPRYNQGILFNNKLNNHSVTEVVSSVAKSKRDLIVVPIYLGKPPMPVLPVDELPK